jgi:hypothetical protein
VQYIGRNLVLVCSNNGLSLVNGDLEAMDKFLLVGSTTIAWEHSARSLPECGES